ncbi:MAG TPA: four helix bundle protein [Gemmatimonadales bacterium]|nr:four helix bundle protein [Gemmatimonadales bacterium]
MGNYRDLEVWKAGQTLAAITYRVTSQFPSAERFGLTAQMRRAAVSIVSNIAEGAGRGTDAQLANFLRIARGSLRELECQSLLSVELGLSTAEAMADLLDANERVGKLLHGLIRAVGG